MLLWMINQLWWNHSNFNWKQIRRPIQGGARWKSLVRREHAMIFGGLGGLVPGKNGLASQAGSGSLVLSTFWHAFDMFFGAHRYFCMPLTKNTDIYAVLSTLTLFKTSGFKGHPVFKQCFACLLWRREAYGFSIFLAGRQPLNELHWPNDDEPSDLPMILTMINW